MIIEAHWELTRKLEILMQKCFPIFVREERRIFQVLHFVPLGIHQGSELLTLARNPRPAFK